MTFCLGVILRNVQHPSFLDWITETTGLLPKSNFDLFLMTCWALWGARNGKMWNREVNTLYVCVERARQWWVAFVKAKTTHRLTARALNRSKWIPPPPGRLKMNIDEAWNEVSKNAGFGEIIRDDIGGFVNAFCGSNKDGFSHL